MRSNQKTIILGCPKCGKETTVFNSRGNGYIRMRERQCKECGYTFMTKEEIVDLPKKETIPHYLNRLIAEMENGSGQRAV